MKRIAFCITELDPGGAERALVQIAARLAARGWDVGVFSLASNGELAAPLQFAKIPVVELGARSKLSWGVLGRLTRALREFQPDLLQTFLFHANLIGRLAARRAKIPCVSGLRVAERDSFFRSWLEKRTNRLVSRYVCVSSGVAQWACDHLALDASRLEIIPNGVDLDRFANAPACDLSSWGIPKGSQTLAFIGRLEEQKDPLTFLKLCHALMQRRGHLHAIIVGDGPLREQAESYAAACGISERVHFTGRLADISGILRAATVFVLTSRWEGMPNVVLEAIAAKCPVVATHVEGISELIPDPSSSQVAPVGDLPALFAAVEQTLDHPQESDQIATSLQQHVRNRFTWDHTVDLYESLYRRILGL